MAVVGLLAGLLGVAISVAVLRLDKPNRPQKFAVQWRSIELSDDRRTITVVTSYPLAGFCAKEPAGVTVRLVGATARVAAWVAEPAAQGNGCTAECGIIRQSVTLEQPLPESVRFEAVDGAVQGCG